MLPVISLSEAIVDGLGFWEVQPSCSHRLHDGERSTEDKIFLFIQCGWPAIKLGAWTCGLQRNVIHDGWFPGRHKKFALPQRMHRFGTGLDRDQGSKQLTRFICKMAVISYVCVFPTLSEHWTGCGVVCCWQSGGGGEDDGGGRDEAASGAAAARQTPTFHWWQSSLLTTLVHVSSHAIVLSTAFQSSFSSPINFSFSFYIIL